MNKLIINKLTVLSVIIIITLCAGIGHAETKIADEKKNNQSNSRIEKSATIKSKKNKPPKEFIPSEEISIDKPVAFPVDI